MPVATRTHAKESSFVSMLSGWAHQGVEGFFATQRILLDAAMRQNASVMHMLREQFSDFRPTKNLTELTEEGVKNFVEAQKVLLDLVQQQNKIVMTGVRERVGGSTTAAAVTDLLQRSVETFVDMQQEYLKIAGKQTHTWLEVVKQGKPSKGEHFVELAQEAVENFVRAQKRFLEVVAEETKKATAEKREGIGKKKHTELSELARQATQSFVDAQKKLFDVAGQQMNANVNAVGKTVDMVRPFPFVPLADLTREGVKRYVDASKALLDVMLKPHDGHKHEAKAVHHVKRPVRHHKPEAAHAASA